MRQLLRTSIDQREEAPMGRYGSSLQSKIFLVREHNMIMIKYNTEGWLTWLFNDTLSTDDIIPVF
jgi:hypothetical protein